MFETAVMPIPQFDPENPRMISQGPEELNIILGVNNNDFEKTIRVIYDSFVK